MKIIDVRILNYTSPEHYWPNAKANPKEPLIVANIQMQLSYEEYYELLNKDNNKQKDNTQC